MILLLTACAADTDPADDPIDEATFLSEPGPYGVGHTEREITYTDAAGQARTLRTAAWYPTHDTDGTPARYWFQVYASEVAWEDAALADDVETPVVLFSHGHMGYAEASSFLAEHLASHGYWVLAPDHTGNTALDDPDRSTPIYQQRGSDLSAVLDALEAGELAASPRLSGDAVLVGHSFGGYTAYGVAGAGYDLAAIDAACGGGSDAAVCREWGEPWRAAFAAGVADARVRALVAMAPGDFWMYGAAGLAAVDVPTLLMTGEHDPERDADGAAYRDALAPAGGRWLDIVGGAHNTFIDLAGSMGDGQTLDRDTGHRIVRAYTLALAEHALGRGDHGAVLDGQLSIDPAAVLE